MSIGELTTGRLLNNARLTDEVAVAVVAVALASDAEVGMVGWSLLIWPSCGDATTLQNVSHMYMKT